MFANPKMDYAELETNYAVVQGQLAVEKANVNALEFSLAKQNDEIKKLEQISGFTSEQAKEYLLSKIESEVRHEAAMKIAEIIEKMKFELENKVN